MRFTGLPVAAATAVLIGVTGSTLATAGSVHADAPVPGPLPLSRFSAMVADGPHGHLFLSGGLGTGSLAVTDFDGNPVGSVDGEPNATSMALSPDGATLYVALPGNNAVSAVDTATLKEKARYSTGTADEPSYLAFAGGKLWFGYGGATAGGIGSIDVGAATPQVSLTPGTWYSAPRLAAGAGASQTLVAGDVGLSPATLRVYDISSGSPVVTATRRTDGSNLADMAVTPDGKDVVVASGAPYYHQVYTLAGLIPDGRYGTSYYPDAVAIAPDGTVAAGVASSTPDVYVFAQGAGTPSHTYDVASGSLADAGLAWDPDGSRLFAVSADFDGSSPVLHVLTIGQKAASRLQVAAPLTAVPGRPLNLYGSLTSSAAFAGGQVVHVVRVDPKHPGGVMSDVPVADDGSFTVTDTPTTEGNNRYQVTYSGDDQHAGATTTVDVNVAKAAATLTLDGPATATRASSVRFTGTLGSSEDLPAGTAVHITRKDASGTAALPDAPVAADGTFAFPDTPQVGGADTYTVGYAGDASHRSASATWQVQVSRAAASVSVTANAANYAYGAAAKVTAHLGTTFNGRTVSLYATPYHGTKTLIRTGTVDAHGNLAGTYTVTRGTTFTVAFAGDYRYAPATASSGVRAWARVTEGQRGYYTSITVGGTVYRVYHHTANPLMGALIAPAKHGECVAFTAQAYVRGAWRNIATAGCVRTGADSQAWATLKGTHAVGYKYRFRTEFVHDATDLANMNTYGAWQYFIFRT